MIIKVFVWFTELFLDLMSFVVLSKCRKSLFWKRNRVGGNNFNPYSEHLLSVSIYYYASFLFSLLVSKN